MGNAILSFSFARVSEVRHILSFIPHSLLKCKNICQICTFTLPKLEQIIDMLSGKMYQILTLPKVRLFNFTKGFNGSNFHKSNEFSNGKQ